VSQTTDHPEDRRRAAFKALVDAQDAGAGVTDSRAQVAAEFGLSVEQVAAIEREGSNHNWQPLERE
jgi:hypothetical protein